MADYRYDNGQNQRPETSTGYWIAAAVLLFVMPPIGVLMLVMKLFGGNRRRGNSGSRHPYDIMNEQEHVGSRTTAQQIQDDIKQHVQKQVRYHIDKHTQTVYTEQSTQGQAGAAQQQPSAQQARHTSPAEDKRLQRKLERQGRGLIVWGAIISGIFGLGTLITAPNMLWWGPGLGEFLATMIPLLTFFAGGVGLLWAGLRKRKQGRRYRNYLLMIGQKQNVSVASIASATGLSEETVLKDLEDMLVDGILQGGYINHGRRMLVMSGEGLWDHQEPAQETKKEAPTQKTVSEENTVLNEIRAVNDAIDNLKLSAQIDRIGVITAQIFDYQKKNPTKSPQLHSFLSYYLPTTLKILRAYAQLEDQAVRGDNITAAMDRIENMMDKVVEGFEKQLDQLYQGDAMDIASDVKVLEQMLANDGLAGGQQIQLEL